jgi:pilus assembly protein CpaF
LEQQIFNSLRKLDAIQDLVDDPTVTEIMVNGPKHIFYERDGKVMAWEGAFSSEERLQDILQQIVARHNRVINLSSPIVDTRLADGSRVNMVLMPIAIDGSVLTIRKFPENPYTMDQMIDMGAISREAAELLKALVQARYSMVISGGTGSGKTTFLNALSQYIPSDERVITIEDSAELQIQGVPNLVRLETRNANVEGVIPISIRDLIRTALRMRPDRIIVGECRGAEAFDMLQAMNTGHDGSLSTAHANSCTDLLGRLEMMVLMGMELPLSAIRRQIASGVDIIVQLGRLRDKSRRVLEITEVCGMEQGEIVLNPLYCFAEHGEENGKIRGLLEKQGTLKNQSKLSMAGIVWKETKEAEGGI